MVGVGYKIPSKSPEETEHLGKKIAPLLKGGEVIYLIGDLGVGKSHLARSIIKALGYGGNIVSPTFVLQQEYRMEKLSLLHLDLYRLENLWELEELGLEEYRGWVYLIEWA